MTKIQKAEKFLAKADPVMKMLIKAHGSCLLKPHENTFYVLCDSIISQQLSVKASATIVKRFCALFPQDTPSAELLLGVPEDVLRGVGCSGAKGRYLKDLAAKFLDGTLQPQHFSTLDDEALIETLVQVKGIGRWTAEMFLIFSLNRLDVMATDDLGLRKAMMNLYNLPELPKRSPMLDISEVWKPYRSVASWYLWRSLDNETSKKKRS
jgi:DNA-3-methyladenine glycosylase II